MVPEAKAKSKGVHQRDEVSQPAGKVVKTNDYVPNSGDKAAQQKRAAYGSLLDGLDDSTGSAAGTDPDPETDIENRLEELRRFQQESLTDSSPDITPTVSLKDVPPIPRINDQKDAVGDNDGKPKKRSSRSDKSKNVTGNNSPQPFNGVRRLDPSVVFAKRQSRESQSAVFYVDDIFVNEKGRLMVSLDAKQNWRKGPKIFFRGELDFSKAISVRRLLEHWSKRALKLSKDVMIDKTAEELGDDLVSQKTFLNAYCVELLFHAENEIDMNYQNNMYIGHKHTKILKKMFAGLHRCEAKRESVPSDFFSKLLKSSII